LLTNHGTTEIVSPVKKLKTTFSKQKMKELNNTIHFPCGAKMKNRFMLALLTNTQSHENGSLSDDEFHWLTMRAKGQFGLVMTCASHV